jgi:hypothetical protein
VVKEMGLAVAEFLRLAPALAEGHPFRTEGHLLWLEYPDGPVRIRLVPRPPRRLAALKIPVTRVELDLSALEPEQRVRFLRRFELRCHRGGG